MKKKLATLRDVISWLGSYPVRYESPLLVPFLQLAQQLIEAERHLGSKGVGP